jgi:hypothetical protein
MTLDQLIAEVALQPTQAKAFTTFLDCLKIEIDDVFAGDSMPPSLQTKYDSVFDAAATKANDILHAIEDGKPALDPLPVKVVSPSDPGGPVSATPTQTVFVDKPETATPPKEPEHGA